MLSWVRPQTIQEALQENQGQTEKLSHRNRCQQRRKLDERLLGVLHWHSSSFCKHRMFLREFAKELEPQK